MLDPKSAHQIEAATMHECRTCKAPDPHLFLPYGMHSPGQMLIRPEDLGNEQPAFQLNAYACLECGLIAVADQLPADFFTHYLYVPSGAATMHTHFAEFADVIAQRAGNDGLIVDIGSNDGLLLAACNDRGCTTLGIDPAANIAEIAAERGVETHVDYFHHASAQTVRDKHGPAKVITTTNTFNHIGDLHSFMEAVSLLLAEDGTFIVEVPWAKEMLANAEFDNMYHEHVSEFSVLSFVKLAEFFGLEVSDVTRLPGIHGGSIRVFITRKSAGFPKGENVDKLLAEELSVGMCDAETYEARVAKFDQTGKALREIIEDMRSQGLKIAGYGASARGSTILTYFGIGAEHLDFLVDKNTLKQGLYSPNTRIPIKPVEAIEQEKPDVLLVLAWNFFDEIRGQQAEFEARGGKFIVPLPEPKVVG